MMNRVFKVIEGERKHTVFDLVELPKAFEPEFIEFLHEGGYWCSPNSLVTLETFCDWLLFSRSNMIKEVR